MDVPLCLPASCLRGILWLLSVGPLLYADNDPTVFEAVVELSSISLVLFQITRLLELEVLEAAFCLSHSVSPNLLSDAVVTNNRLQIARAYAFEFAAHFDPHLRSLEQRKSHRQTPHAGKPTGSGGATSQCATRSMLNMYIPLCTVRCPRYNTIVVVYRIASIWGCRRVG